MLNPRMPDAGEPIAEHLTKKYGPAAVQRFNDPNSSLRVSGRAVGIEFNDNRKAVNTKRAHALVEYLKEQRGNDAANQFMQDLYKIYFEDGQDINDETILVEAIGKHRVDAEQARRVMAPDYLDEIEKKDQQYKAAYRVSGVPFFMIHPNTTSEKKKGKSRQPIAFSGAYPVQVIAEQLEEAANVQDE